ncbi:MAG: F0F1 ATP synthase subunit epsilon [Gammaproteobacteria bacterium]|nr:F0F1 ATP synthase subunit epsilon [Gammaproteobacteria bacterium]
MALQMHVDVVSAERSIFTGLVEQLHIRGEMGELGIYPRHSPLFTKINPGLLRLVLSNGQQEAYFISSGFLEVQPHVVTVLADTVIRSEELDAAAAQAAREIEQFEGKKRQFDKELALNIALIRALDEVKRA